MSESSMTTEQPLEPMDDVLVSMDGEGVHVVSRSVAEKVESKQISPSLITAVVGENACPARWMTETFVVPEVIDQPVDTPATRGSMFHKVMENFFDLDEDERTKEKVFSVAKEVMKTDEFKELAKIKDARVWLKTTLSNYFDMGADPSRVKIAEVEYDGKTSKGLEVFVKGSIGSSSRQVLGFIDRLQEKPDGSVVVVDYKTGAKAKKWNPNTSDETGLAEQRQQIIYSMLLENMGMNVSDAMLIYPAAGSVVKVRLKDKDLRARVVSDVEKADDALTTMQETNSYEYNPSFLCAWCPMAKMCPKATIKPYQKMQQALAQQPEAQDFKGAVQMNF